MEKKELFLLFIDSFLGLEYKHKKYLADSFTEDIGVKAFIEKNREYISANCGNNAYNTILNSSNESYFNYVKDEIDKNGIKWINLYSDKYPKKLLDTPVPPLVLYCKGDISLLNGDIFAMVGSRKSLPFSVSLAKNFAKELCDSGFTLITGIAEGVDSAVIEGALSSTGKIISVFAGGLDNVYPPKNIGLAEEVVKRGLIISEYPLFVKPQSYFFPVRNRIIAGMSNGVLIVSGAKRSGTSYTAGYAIDYGRDLFAIPYNVGIESGEGCNELIREGASLTVSAKDIIEFYGKEVKSGKIDLSDDEKEIISILKDGEKHVEKICEITGKKIYIITPILMNLEIKGIVSKNGVNVYGLIRSDLEV